MKEQEQEKVKASVIIAVYNHFNWLRLILDALRMQTEKNFEVVIADDGSNAETVAAIKDYMQSHPELRIVHSWQEDKGWQKNKSLNKAVRASSADYLIFIDGDCIPHPRFVEDHLALREKGTVLGGRRVDMNASTSDKVARMESLPKDYFRKIRREVLRSTFRQSLPETMSQFRRTIHFPRPFGKGILITEGGFFGCNFSIFRSDLEKVNGFDERYPDPGTGEDTDLDLRLENAGIRHKRFSHYALMLHRKHKRLVFDSKENARLLREAREKKLTYVETGLNRKPEENKEKSEG